MTPETEAQAADPRSWSSASALLLAEDPTDAISGHGNGGRWWRDKLRRRMLAGADGMSGLGVGAAIVLSAAAPAPWILVPVPIALLTAKLLGLYEHDHRCIRHQTVDELGQLAALVGITVVCSILLLPGYNGATDHFLLLTLGLVIVCALRGSARAWWRAITPPERTLVLGEGGAAEAIRRKIELFADMHLTLVREPHPVISLRSGGEDPLEAMLEGVDRVVIAWAQADPKLIERLLELCKRHQVKLSVVSPFRGRARPTLKLSQIAELPILEYNTWDVPRSTMALKRAFDIIVATVALLLCLPLFLLIAAAIKLDSRGPVFFRQRRAGRHGKPFTLFKFRSMCPEAEAELEQLLCFEELGEPVFKLRDDPRTTRVGRLLRRFSLDELPQLVNVLFGSMSIVGPRPEQLELVARYRPEHRFRLALRPGMTGPMQVFGRGELTMEERLAVELDYIENLSLSRDFGVLLRTGPVISQGTGAF